MTFITAKIKRFIQLESSGGLLLALAAVMAFAISNSPLAPLYSSALAWRFGFDFAGLAIEKPLLLWVNDGLMAIFFFLIGLEIKREVLQGELSTLKQAALPLFAAAGGILAPALVYIGLNAGDSVALRGWATPAATDIAFALAILGLLGRHATAGVKIFLMAVAIIDDLAAILIIALFYTDQLSMQALWLAALSVLGLFALNRSGVVRIAPYAIVGFVLWLCVLKSGVHATVAGVITAFAVPLFGKTPLGASPLHGAISALHPFVAYFVLPIFAFANAGVSLSGVTVASLAEPLPLGIVLGLVVGKPLGILAFSAAAVKLKAARLPDDVSKAQLVGAACLCGVGFTMSLLMASLAFDDAAIFETAKLGVLAGSIVSALLGSSVFFIASRLRKPAISAQSRPVQVARRSPRPGAAGLAAKPAGNLNAAIEHPMDQDLR